MYCLPLILSIGTERCPSTSITASYTYLMASPRAAWTSSSSCLSARSFPATAAASGLPLYCVVWRALSLRSNKERPLLPRERAVLGFDLGSGQCGWQPCLVAMSGLLSVELRGGRIWG